MTTNAAEKRRIRAEMRERRRSISAVAQGANARRLAGAIQYQGWFRGSRRLACYWAMDGEISLEPLIALSWGLGKRVYLPVVGERGAMLFREYRRGDPLRKNRMGILEPLAIAETTSAGQLDVVFVPLVAFTAGGGRLGMGGGYYDRLFSRHASPAGRTPGAGNRRGGPRLVGVAHHCQLLDSLPVDDWDVPMDMILTESGAVRFDQSE